jgi:Flp pilus assembly protein TadB
MLAKYMGGLLVANLVIIAVITLLVWMFVICALKPGFPVYNWREVGARSRYSRFSSESHAQLTKINVNIHSGKPLNSGHHWGMKFDQYRGVALSQGFFL